jgi:hypothetical protein
MSSIFPLIEAENIEEARPDPYEKKNIFFPRYASPLLFASESKVDSKETNPLYKLAQYMFPISLENKSVGSTCFRYDSEV